jgi:hypothetical protein
LGAVSRAAAKVRDAREISGERRGGSQPIARIGVETKKAEPIGLGFCR